MTKKIILRCIGVFMALVIIASAVYAVCLIKTEEATVAYDGVIDLGTISEANGLLTNIAVSHLYDTYGGGSCSAAVKTVDNGDTIIGRNLDMKLSNYPVYIGRTDVDGYYETIFATYIPEFGTDYDSCIDSGVPTYIKRIMPFVALDSMNIEGLYIQINMREDQKDEDGNYVFCCEHTNEDAETRISAVELPSYVTMRCKNVEEAVELINNLDIYTLGGDINWPFTYLIADAEGNCGLLELGCNEARWIPGQNIQTNFYISEDFNAMQKYKQGLGRYDYIESRLDSVTSENDMLDLIQDVRYSQIYDLNNSNFDIRSEMAGDSEEKTNEYLDDEDNWNEFKKAYQEQIDVYNTLTQDEKRDANEYWASIYSTVANLTQKTIRFSFYEDYSHQISLDFDGVVIEADEKISVYAVVALEIMAIIVSLILLYGNIYETRRNTERITRKQKLFSAAVIVNIIGTTADMISWIYDGNTNCLVLLKWVTGISMGVTYLLLGVFGIYLYAFLVERQEISRTAFRLYGVACIVAIAITEALYLKGLFYTVTDAYYYEAPLYILYTAITAVYIVALLIIVASYRKILGKHDMVAVVLYVVVPVISALISTRFPAMSVGYPAASLAILVVYIMLQSETTNRLSDEKNVSSYRVAHDELTGLLSRRAYVEQIDLFEKGNLDGSGYEANNIGVIFADINGLKYTNDRFGHVKGDDLLLKFANAAKKVFHADNIYRISGDEFVVLLPGMTKDKVTEKVKVFEKVLKEYEYQIACFGCEYGSSGKISELVSMAENEMYEWKKEFYKEHPEMRR